MAAENLSDQHCVGAEPPSCQMLDLPLTLAKCLLACRRGREGVPGLGLRGPRGAEPWLPSPQSPGEDVIGRQGSGLELQSAHFIFTRRQGLCFGGKAHRRAVTEQEKQ